MPKLATILMQMFRICADGRSIHPYPTAQRAMSASGPPPPPRDSVPYFQGQKPVGEPKIPRRVNNPFWARILDAVAGFFSKFCHTLGAVFLRILSTVCPLLGFLLYFLLPCPPNFCFVLQSSGSPKHPPPDSRVSSRYFWRVPGFDAFCPRFRRRSLSLWGEC